MFHEKNYTVLISKIIKFRGLEEKYKVKIFESEIK